MLGNGSVMRKNGSALSILLKFPNIGKMDHDAPLEKMGF
jgi:hypothetical protein